MADLKLPREPHRPVVLVVDDDAELCRFVELVLQDDHDVRSVASGEAALALCRELQPDLILLDFELPGLAGLEVSQRLRGDDATRAVPVIFITAHHSAEVEDSCWEAGAVDFVAKPLHARTLANRVKAHLTLKAQSDQLRELAFKDALTGLANRRYFHDRIEAEMGRARRLSTPLSMLLIDVDHFKPFNDRYGHLAGDRCLAVIAAALRAALHRPTDVVARIGGEEFGCLLPDTAIGSACAVGERMRAAVEALGLPHEDSTTAEVVTVSAGAAEIHLGAGQNLRTWLADADAHLYRAKRRGRNQVCGDSNEDADEA